MLHLMTPVRLVLATPVSISIPTLLIEALVLIGMVFLMERLVFGPIRSAWRERDERIQAGLEATSETRDEAQEAHEEVRNILATARRRAQETLDEVTSEGEQARVRAVDEATAEFQRLVNEARVQIQAEQAQAAAQMRNLVIDLALEAASKVSGRGYDSREVRELAASVVSREGLG